MPLFRGCVQFACERKRGYRRLLALLITARFFASTSLLAAQPASPKIDIRGELIESSESIRSALGLDAITEVNEATLSRCQKILEQLGYQLTLRRPSPNRYIFQLDRFRLVRRVYVRGNWPIREEEIMSRLRFRPGQRVASGAEFSQWVEQEKMRMREFLGRRGYFDGNLEIRLEQTDDPFQVNVHAKLNKGRNYKIGDVIVQPLSQTTNEPVERSRSEWNSAVPVDEIAKLFRYKKILGLIPYRPTFDTEHFKASLDELKRRFQERGYPGVRINGNYDLLRNRPTDRAVRITLQIQPRKKITLHFIGNNQLSDKRLTNALTLFESGAYDDYELGQSVDKLHRLYQSQGLLQARVTFARDVGPRGDDVRFFIDEGPRCRVDKVRIVGNKAISSDELRAQIRTRSFPFLGYLGLGKGGYVTDKQLRQDVERIQNYYLSKGFSAVALSTEILFEEELHQHAGAIAAVSTVPNDGSPRSLVVYFMIDEGSATSKQARQTRVGTIALVGSKAFESARILSMLSMKRNAPFTPQMVSDNKKRIIRFYAERGHPYATVRSRESESRDGSAVDVQFRIDEGKSAKIGPIFLRGNFKTRNSTIEEAIDIKRGDRFNITKLLASELKLRNVAVFNAVRFQLLTIAEKPDHLPIMIGIEERYDDFGSLEFGVGGSTDNSFFVSTGYVNRNVMGFGVKLDVRGEFGPQLQSGNIDLYNPRFLNSDVSADLRLFVRNERTVRLGDVTTFGTTLTFSREFLAGLRLFLRYEIRQIQRDELLNRASGALDDSQQISVLTRAAGLSPALIYDRRDNPITPTRGFRLSATLFGASTFLGGTNNFVKLQVTSQNYIPLPLGITIAISARYDQGFPLGGEVVLPKTERLFAGGDTTIRGIEEDLAFAERVQVAVAPISGVTLIRRTAQGGNIRLLTNIEFQVPIWKKSFIMGMPLLAAIFLDNGVVTNSFDDFFWHDFRQSMGGALRIATFAGFLSFEYAWPLDPGIGDARDGRFHFNFGYAF